MRKSFRKVLTQKQKIEKRKKIQVLIKRIVAVLVLVILAGFGFRIGQFLKTGRLPEEGRLNVGFASNQYVIASLSPDEKTLSFLLIPKKTLIEATQGYGQYRLEAYEHLAEVEKKPFLLQESLTFYLSLPIEGWIGESLDLPESQEARILKKWYQRQIWLTFKEKKKTSLVLSDLLRLGLLSLSIRIPNIKIVSLEKNQGLEEVKFPDGTFFYEIDLEKTDSLVSDLLFEAKIKKEKLTIGVANATGRTGLAKKASRMVTNLGGAVLKMADWPETLASSEVRVKSKEKTSFTARELSRVFNCQIKEGNFDKFLVDILLIVGEDFWQRLNEKSEV